MWALAANRLPSLRTKALWWFIAVAEITIFVQVGLGVYLVAGEKVEAPQFHMLYGFAGLFAVGILYSYRSQLEPHKYKLYGFGSLFLMGLGIRAMLVGAT